MTRGRAERLPLLAGALLLACGGASSAASPRKAADGRQPGPGGTPAQEPPAGKVTRAAVEALPAWARAGEAANPDAAAAKALLAVPRGATVRVYLGTWCGDSRREVSRFWRALDAAGGAVPFAIDLIAVDHAKAAPDGLTAGVDLRYVPTFVVLRSGKEIGRVVESAPAGIERDLAALLRGERTGVISGRTDLAP